MISAKRKMAIPAVLLILLAGALGWALFGRSGPVTEPGRRAGVTDPAPVAVAAIEKGQAVLRRSFSGTLEPRAQFVVAPKVSGRVERVLVNLADTVERGQVVAELDNEEYVQAVAQARADLAVARANLAEAVSALKIAERDLARIETLRSRGVASESQYDSAAADRLAKEVQVEADRARVARAEAALEATNIRLGYTTITAGWSGGNERRVVAERYVDEGETVSANTPLLLIVELQPITGVIFVTEGDYARLEVGQPVTLTTDAYPGEPFHGRVERIAPVFREKTRQARIELTVDNPGRRLRPGMFIRAEIVLARIEEATLVPEQALVTRGDRIGVFVVDEGGGSVTWRDVAVGIRDGDRVEVHGQGLEGRVVILGQQLIDDGSPVTIPSREAERP